MNRLSRVAVLLVVAMGVLVPLAPGPAHADPIGGVIVIPGTGSDLDPLRLRTSAGCPAKANAYYAKMRGPGFPPDGQIITTNTDAGMSHSIGFDVYVGLIMRDYATDNHITLGGRYDITVYCANHVTLKSYGEFAGSLEFTSPTRYEALGAAKPTGPPPPPLDQDPYGFAPAPDTISPPVGTSAGPGAPIVAAQAAPRSAAGQLTAERNDATGHGIAWLIAAAAVLVAGVVIAVANRIRKRRSS
jgi:hypothetical protein